MIAYQVEEPNMQHILSNNDSSYWQFRDSSAQPLFAIKQSVLEEIREFRQSHTDISPELFNQELNATLIEMLFRLDRQSRGDA